jgi:hypothetical protein
MEDLPIDIHITKLLEWLISRRHCSQQWQESAFVIREKINQALQDMPEVEEVRQLLEGTYINYFHCQKIVELLKETEAGTKNVFGYYSSQRMKDWQEICRLYEKDGVNLAEAANLLMRNVNYEIPALKKQIAKYRQQQSDYTRKESEYAGSGAELREKFNIRCRQIGIEGKRIKTELMSLVKDMPKLYTEVAGQAKSLLPAVEFYLAFVKFLLPKATHVDRLQLLRYVIAKGNSTVYEWKSGTKPTRVIEPTFDMVFKDEETADSADDAADANDEIDWGAFGDGESSELQLDDGSGIVGLDDDTPLKSETDNENVNKIAIEIINDSGAVNDHHDEEGTARGRDALSLLDDVETRNAFINNLLELEAFVAQRLAELRSDSQSFAVSNQFQAAPNEVQRDSAELEVMLANIRNVLVKLTAPHVVELLLIRTSPKFVERLAASLHKLLSDSDKVASLSRLMAQRRTETLEEERLTQPKLDLTIAKTKELQKQVEAQISKKYNNRKVNIMGEINLI